MRFSLLAVLCCFTLSGNHLQPLENYTETVDGYHFKMIAIEGSSFQMGSPDSEFGRKADEGPLHQVMVGDFWMAEHEVTWNLYEKFMARKIGSETFSPKIAELGIEVDAIAGATTPYVDMSFGMGKDGYPVTSVTQHAALSFCKWLSAKTGHFYRLPTEAEWEYACKKGTQYGVELGYEAWYKENSQSAYHKVGEKAANALGLHDMLGNVAEWTMDQYRPDFYSQSPSGNPWAVPTKLYPRTLRGGSWKDDEVKCRCAARKASSPNWKQIDPQLPKSRWWHTSAPFIGFRAVRPYSKPSAKEIEKFWLPPIDDY